MISTQDILTKCEVPYIALHLYCVEQKIKGMNMAGQNGRIVFYTDEDGEKIIDHFTQKNKDKADDVYLKSLSKEEYIKEMKKRHPLVTDVRCFNANYWPDPMPDCLRDVEL